MWTNVTKAEGVEFSVVGNMRSKQRIEEEEEEEEGTQEQEELGDVCETQGPIQKVKE